MLKERLWSRLAMISCFLPGLNIIAFAQSDEAQKALADNYLAYKDYEAAFKIYSDLVQNTPESPEINYKLAVSLFHTTASNKLRSLRYFEFVFNNLDEDIPEEIYYYLGRCYHYKYRFLEALNMYSRYLENTTLVVRKFQDVGRRIEISENAIQAYNRPLKDVSTTVLSFPVNTSYNEEGPLVTSQGGLMFFSSNRPQNSFNLVYGNNYPFLPDEMKNDFEDVFMSNRRGIGWSYPDPVEISSERSVTLSISFDGTAMLLYIGDTPETGDIYISYVKKAKWTLPRKIGGKVNSKYIERGACFASFGDVIYFGSTRPGGYGGFDLYEVHRVGKNDWSEPENLGTTINTPYDEVNPYMLPDNKTLFFSSQGHNTMGDLDIFMARLEDDAWSEPKNMGYPINSVFNDDYYFQQNTKYAYLSSDRMEDESIGGHDIIAVFRPEKKIPLTMVNGVMRAYEDGKNIDISLQIADENNTLQRYIYNPDSETGKYFMILPPNGAYSMEILLGKDRKHTLNINIPKNTYRYEFNYELDINSIEVLGEVIGAHVKPRKSSYTITRLKDLSSEETVKEVRYDALTLLMEQIIDRSDVTGLENLEELEKQVEYINPEVREADTYYTPILQAVEDAILKADPRILAKLETGPWEKKGQNSFFYGKKISRKDKRLLLRKRIAFEDNRMVLSRQDSLTVHAIADLLNEQPEINMEITCYDTRVGQKSEATIDEEVYIEEICDFLEEKYVNKFRYKVVKARERGRLPFMKRRNNFVVEFNVYR